MGGWMVVCVCVHVHWCIHAYMYTSMRENLRMCHLRLCLYVCIFVRMLTCVCVCVCVYLYLYIYIYIYTNTHIYVYIYIFLLHNGAVFHSSGTFILRSTDGYLAFVCLNMTHTAHFVFNTTGFCQFLHLNRQQLTSHRGCLPSHNSTLAVVATSVSLLLATIE